MAALAPAGVLTSLSVILLSGFTLTRVTKRLRLPDVTGYILAGILIGPGVLNLVPADILEHMDFVSDAALAFIAFGVGRWFRRDTLRDLGGSLVLVTLMEALVPGILVAGAMHWVFGMGPALSLLLGAIATATAPASTLMTIRQYRADGSFVRLLLAVVALDDAVCLLAFSAASVAVDAMEGAGISWQAAVLPLARNGAVLVLGGFLGLALEWLLAPSTRSQGNRLILTIAVLLGLCGVCAALAVSPLLACMVCSAVYINRTGDQFLYTQVEDFSPPVMSLFFIVSGMNLDLNALKTVGAAGVGYFFIRILGKYAGAWLGCRWVGTEKHVRDWLGLALIPQAGVAIGLAFLGKRVLPPDIGDLLLTVILASSVLYELIGPGCAKLALLRSGAIPEPAARDGERHG